VRFLAVATALSLLVWAGEACAAEAASRPSWWQQAVVWVFEQQRAMHRELAAQLRSLSGDGAWLAGWGLVGASLLYGVFHAAGPGHGKAVITAYLFSHEDRVGRGLWLAAASSLVQGLVAVAIVYGLIMIGGWLPREAQSAVSWSERISFGLLAVLGAALAARALRGLVRTWRGADRRGHDHAHDPSCGCGHVPRPADRRDAAAVILSVGLRPCSGAVLVLVLANLLGLAWAGLAAVLAMSLGTAATVAVLALLAVKARRWMLAVVARDVSVLTYAGHGLALAGGAAILALASAMLAGSFGPAHPLGL